MKNILLVLFVISFHLQAKAMSRVYGYDYFAPLRIQNYLQAVDQYSPANGTRSCESMYAPMTKDGVLDVRYALGYFDDSNGKENSWDGVNWGYSPSLDIPVFQALRAAFITPCSSRTLRLCGFSEQGNPANGKVVLTKRVKLQGTKVLVRLTLTQASASEYFERNKSDLRDRQNFLTRQSEENFFGGLKEADIVLYNGHSRNGGGPDFTWPVLNAEKKTDYVGYYQVKKTGIKRTMAALAENPNKDIVVGFFSCYAQKHFYDTFMSANPHQRIILSADTIDNFDAIEASLGYLEGMLRGSCGDELNATARQGQKVRQGFQGFNLN